jgi:hypothetical protein
VHEARDPRISEASAAELLEAVLARRGWNIGIWNVTLHADDGHVRRAVAVKPASPRTTLGRNQLDVRERAD